MSSILKQGDEIRVISPSTSMKIISADVRTEALKKLEEIGLKISFSDHVEIMDERGTSPLKDRLADLHAAYADRNVKAIMTSIGGFHANEVLPYVDYDLIRHNPKPLIGYSDITALQNAIYAQTGVQQFSGPHFSSFGMKKGLSYTLETFVQILLEEQKRDVPFSSEWSDDLWFLDQENRQMYPNKGPKVVNAGEATGILVGGNLGTLNLLQGTPYMPSLENKILFVEDDADTNIHVFIRQLHAVLQQPNAETIKGIMIGRFQKKSDINLEILVQHLKTLPLLQKIPVIVEMDFGHTTPQMILPIGGKVGISAAEEVRLGLL